VKALGRFVFRGCNDSDGLLIGVSFRNHEFFKRNTVYEIRDVFGEVSIHAVGESIIRHIGEEVTNTNSMLTWGSSVNQLLDETGRELVLTREEYKQILYGRRRQDLIREYGEDRVNEWELEGKDLNEITY
jgi:hypothetical protein